jgi:hypothetical protein
MRAADCAIAEKTAVPGRRPSIIRSLVGSPTFMSLMAGYSF